MSQHVFHFRFSMAGIILLLQWAGSYASPIATASLSSGRGSMPAVETVEVKCGRSGMNVHVAFDRPFPGVIYSKGHFYDPDCNYVTSKNTSENTFSFLISVNACGTSGKLDPPTPDREMYYENTIIIQNDPLIQEVWDEARRLKCTWKNSFSKAVRSKPITIQNPDMVEVDFDSRSVNTLMQIQKGSFPFSAPALGYIYVGDDTSLVIYLKDSSGKLDANAVSCTVSSSKGAPVELVDRNGCLVRPSLMTSFTKIRHPEGVEADLMLYSYFKAFRVGDDPNFKVTCQLEVCEGSCLEPCALGPVSEEGGIKRRKRELVPPQFKTKKVIQIEHATLILGKGNSIDVEERQFQTAKCETVLITMKSLILFAAIQFTIMAIITSINLKCFPGNGPRIPVEADVGKGDQEGQRTRKTSTHTPQHEEKDAKVAN